MGKINVIWQMLTITRNPFTGLYLKISKTRKPVTFRKHKSTYHLTYPQYRIFRENYPFLLKYRITQLTDDTFKIQNQTNEVTCPSELIPMILDLMKDYSIHQENQMFHLKDKKMEVFGSVGMLYCLQEIRRGDYNYEYKDKVVLDVGGFEGESAVYFWSKGAKKVIVYEPVTEHIETIRKNMALNQIEAEIHNSGVGPKNGTKMIQYSRTDPGFGLFEEGKNKVQIRINDISKVIAKSGADIAKFDCEGAEIHLIDVSEEILRKVSYYIIEVHSPEIRQKIVEKFEHAGFELENERIFSEQYAMVYLKK